jgi:exopolysaccharide biosynthesis polyprenyl glycosylphosphotransferase
VFSRQARKLRLLLAAADLPLIWLAFEAAYQTRARLPLEREFFLTDSVRTLLLLAGMVAWVLTGLALRVYDEIASGGPARLLWQGVRQALVATAALVLFEFARRLDLSRPFMAFYGAYALLFLVLFRLSVRFLINHVAPGFAEPRYVWIAGCGESALRIGRMLEERAKYGFRLSGFFDDQPGQVRLGKDYGVLPFESLPAVLKRQVIDEIIFAVDRGRLAELEETLLLCDEEGVRTRVSVDLFPHVNSAVYLDRLGSLPLLTFSAAPHDEIRLMFKRFSDAVLAAAALLAAAPLMLPIALLVKITSPGPVIFRQTRCGLNGRRFTCYKFRTMVAGAERKLAEVAHLNVKKTNFKIPNDPRLTPLGAVLRKFSLDELPQLWNVLRGEMSLVGPRPALPSEVEQYKRWQRRRLRMRPGLTCLWALAGRDALDFEEVMRLDLAYIDTWSLALDWSIIVRTIPHVVTGKGAN